MKKYIIVVLVTLVLIGLGIRVGSQSLRRADEIQEPTKASAQGVTVLPMQAVASDRTPGVYIHKYEVNAEETGYANPEKIYEEYNVGEEIKEEGILPAAEHEFEKLYVMNSGPTCQSHGYYNWICSKCGVYGGDGTDPSLPHTPDAGTVVNEGHCNSERVVQYFCIYCGCPCGEDRYYVEGAHYFVEKIHSYWDYERKQVVTEKVMQCEHGCGTILEE